MKILFLVKFYQPFDRGGSEWSTHDLAKLMVKNGHQVTIITPNYGAKSHEFIEGIKIRRIPFIKLNNPKGPIAPYWTNNIIWFLYSTLYCTYESFKNEVDIIHAHSNEFIPAAVVASLILKRPSVATFRDYQAICSLGFCLWQKDRACNFSDFVKNDFSFFYNHYAQHKNPIGHLILLSAAIRARIIQKIIYFFARKINYKIAVSQKVASIFKSNGIKVTAVIHNPVIIRTKIIQRSSNEIVYVGKFSKGKGVDMLVDLIPDILKEIPQAKFKLIGSGYLEKELKINAKKMHFGKNVTFSGQIRHSQVLAEVKNAVLVVVPSIWPEPLPRSAIEAILSGTPVVAADVGGLNEVIRDNVYGILCEPNASSLKKAIIKGFTIKNTLRKNIRKDLTKLRKHFAEEVTAKYEKIYQLAHPS